MQTPSHDLALDVASFNPPDAGEERVRWLQRREDDLAEFTASFVEQSVAAAFSALADSVTAAGDVATLDSILPDWRTFVRAVSAEYAGGMFAAGVVAAWNDAPEAFQSAEFLEDIGDLTAAEVERVVANLDGFGADLIEEARAEAVRRVSQSATIEALRDGLAEVTDQVKDRAEARARDVTIGTYNHGHTLQARRMGADWKEWLAASDARTRPDHVEANGQRVGIDEPFMVGGEAMDRPHDPAGSPSQTYNCRCTVLFGWNP